jgi:acetolactate synthase-1/3 small subunit
MRERNMQMTIQLWLEDKHGVLMRVAGILTAKGCNIVSLHLAPDPWKDGVSRMTIVAEVEERLQERVVKEMNRLINVLLAIDITGQCRGVRPAERMEAAC